MSAESIVKFSFSLRIPGCAIDLRDLGRVRMALGLCGVDMINGTFDTPTSYLGVVFQEWWTKSFSINNAVKIKAMRSLITSTRVNFQNKQTPKY